MPNFTGLDSNGNPVTFRGSGAGTAGDPLILDRNIAYKDLSFVSSTAAVSGDNVIVAAPGAGLRIVVEHFTVQNEPVDPMTAYPITMILKDGASARFRCCAPYMGDGLSVTFPAGREWRLAANSALLLNLSLDQACGCSVSYWIEAVP